MPSFRLTEKKKHADVRYRKVYEKYPRAPYQRLMESPDVSSECKAELNRSLNEAVRLLLKTNSEKLLGNAKA